MDEVIEMTSSVERHRLFQTFELIPGVSVFGKMKREILNRSIFLPKIDIMGIPFVIKREENEIVLESERWPSLRASGNKVQEAIDEMRSLMSDVVEEYIMCSEEDLSEDAKEFRHYLLSTII